MDFVRCLVFLFTGAGRTPDSKYIFYWDRDEVSETGLSEDVIETYLWSSRVGAAVFVYSGYYTIPRQLMEDNLLRYFAAGGQVDVTEELLELSRQYPGDQW